MVVKNIYITESQSSILKTIGEKTGYGMSELVRRAIDNYVRETIFIACVDGKLEEVKGELI